MTGMVIWVSPFVSFRVNSWINVLRRSFSQSPVRVSLHRFLVSAENTH
jgi:hypothetical protein